MMIISYALMGFCFATYNYMLLYFNELGNEMELGSKSKTYFYELGNTMKLVSTTKEMLRS